MSGQRQDIVLTGQLLGNIEHIIFVILLNQSPSIVSIWYWQDKLNFEDLARVYMVYHVINHVVILL